MPSGSPKEFGALAPQESLPFGTGMVLEVISSQTIPFLCRGFTHGEGTREPNQLPNGSCLHDNDNGNDWSSYSLFFFSSSRLPAGRIRKRRSM